MALIRQLFRAAWLGFFNLLHELLNALLELIYLLVILYLALSVQLVLGGQALVQEIQLLVHAVHVCESFGLVTGYLLDLLLLSLVDVQQLLDLALHLADPVSGLHPLIVELLLELLQARVLE